MSETTEVIIPTPANAMVYFFVLTIIYSFFAINMILSQNSLEGIQNNSSNSVVMIIYILLLKPYLLGL